MDTNVYYFTLMLIPLLAGRSMTAIFAGAFYAYLEKNNWLHYLENALGWFNLSLHPDALKLMVGLPEFASDYRFIIITFILAILEKRMSESTSFQEVWALNEAKIKGIFALIISFVMVDKTTNEIIQSLVASTNTVAPPVENAFLRLENLWVGFIGFLTWLLAAIRSSIMLFLMEADYDDSLGIRKLIGRLEGVLGIFGPLLFLILPIAALFCVVIAFGIMALIKWRVRQLEKKHEQACPNCQKANHLSALHCGHCDTPLSNVRDVGFMGLSRVAVPKGDDKAHIQKLLQARRCGYCAGRGNNQGISSKCKTCERMLFPNEEDVNTYIANVQKKVLKTLGVTSICGFFPIIGLIPGIIFYRLYLINNLKIYVLSGSGVFIRIILRIFFVFLILWNFTPLLGFVSIPIMAMANYYMYVNSVKNQRYSTKYKRALEQASAENVGKTDASLE